MHPPGKNPGGARQALAMIESHHIGPLRLYMSGVLMMGGQVVWDPLRMRLSGLAARRLLAPERRTDSKASLSLAPLP